MKLKAVAAIDLGTNSFRLAVADLSGKPLFKSSAATKMGEGLAESGAFCDAAVERLRTALGACRWELDKFDIAAMRAVATEASRVACNAPEVFAAIKREFGIAFEVISAEEEARLTLKGAISHVAGKSKHVVMFDIGGGSTELTLAENDAAMKVLAMVSIPLGALNAAEKLGICDYDEAKAAALRAEIAPYISQFMAAARGYLGKAIVVASGGSGLRLLAMAKDSGTYDREDLDGQVLGFKEAEKAIAKVYKTTLAEREASVYTANRAKIFIAAMVIFEEIIGALGAQEMVVSLRTAKDGIIEELIEKYDSVL